MRYFADVEMGKFLDRMEKEGILNDTIIVISGDHGQGPEFGNDVPEDRDVSATRVAGAIIAEGRLGSAVGMVIDDATEQYDLLNTLADITGVPEGGFEQDGVGRSLKRKMAFGERTVYSNNPTRKMSVVRGHLRLRYDKATGSMLLHNADTDHDMKHDLLPDLTSEEREQWITRRDAGRRINCEKHYTVELVLQALGLGFLQDVVCATYFACTLWVVDSIAAKCSGQQHRRVASRVVTFVLSWLLFVAVMAPFVADLVLVRTRGMRFTLELVVMAVEESEHFAAVAVSSSEISDATLSVTEFLLVATFFAIVRTWAAWADLSAWNPTHAVLSSEDSLLYLAVSGSDDKDGSRTPAPTSRRPKPNDCRKYFKQSMVVLAGLVVLPLIVVAISCASSPLVAYSALNTTLNELFAHALEPTMDLQVTAPTIIETVVESTEENAASYSPENAEQDDRENQSSRSEAARDNSQERVHDSSHKNSNNDGQGASQQSRQNASHTIETTIDSETAAPTPKPSVKSVTIPWVESFIDFETEEHTLLGENTLHRRTTGFKGDLAFDVNVSDDNPPNVLVIVVEAFRYHDSHYLVGEKDPSYLFKGSNITVTPSFDKWAKRGIALRNFWSSWRTSRSVESLMFAQLPYDSVTKSGMTGGQHNTKLAGLPQLYSAKGYETFFTTGCLTDYDGWDSFLPTHGFDTVWSRNEMMTIAENELGIRHDQWHGEDHRGLNWGVHDDLSFRILGDLMVNKTKEQRARVESGEPKKPLYLNHYTISSHVDYKQRPKWYDEAKKPNFSALYEGEEYADNIKNYLEMRYFADVEMGKFLDRMEKEGILNDTIIVPLLLKGV
ncbi:unnamed protein product [Phytophthora fragariaefolia]|uniref:Unnamed protein product n=1 Tax=Phytophthora fragariaefolia TaxID=1490495 RepID=A0A9W7DAE5_9STRA|nr:unnamed protein product [Phytophthora fragariaefolia]